MRQGVHVIDRSRVSRSKARNGERNESGEQGIREQIPISGFESFLKQIG